MMMNKYIPQKIRAAIVPSSKRINSLDKVSTWLENIDSNAKRMKRKENTDTLFIALRRHRDARNAIFFAARMLGFLPHARVLPRSTSPFFPFFCFFQINTPEHDRCCVRRHLNNRSCIGYIVYTNIQNV